MIWISCHPDGCYLSAEPESDRAIPVQLDAKSEAAIRGLLDLESFKVSEALGQLAMACLTMAGAAHRKPLPKPEHVVTS